MSFHTQRAARVIRIKSDEKSLSKQSLDFTKDNERRGIGIYKDHRGFLYIARMSPDGWVQAYHLYDGRRRLKVGPRG